ncbi:MAG: methionine synthase, partial [Planctomycetota bacterium]
PERIRQIHREYLEAGADCIETNTFGATPLVLAEYDIAEKAEELNFLAATLAREEVDRISTPERALFVLGSMGPTTKTLTVTGGISFDELRESYRVQSRGLLRGGADILILETVQDTLNLKAGYLGILNAYEDTGIERPIALSCTIEPMGAMLAGQSVEAFYTSIEHIQPIFIGMNCATGPRFMTDHLRTLASISSFPVSCYPNAGLPNHEGLYELSPEMLAEEMKVFLENGWLNLLGGCCGTTHEHVRALHAAVQNRTPRKLRTVRRSAVAGIETQIIDEDTCPIIIGERTNVIGSRKFKRLAKSHKYEEGAEIGRAQVRGGAHILDVCMADPDANEGEGIERLLGILTKMVKVPIMIDSTEEEVIESALKLCQGKSIINSINLEDGEERFESVVPLARRFGAALVVGCIDEDPEDGMAVTCKRKLEVARRSHDLLTRKYGIAEENLIFDPLVFPVGTGDVKYTASAGETIEGVRAIKEALPRCHTILGISNVSFGLPPGGREVLNSVFLYHCVQAGLSMAIVNSEKLERFAAIPEKERRLCEDLIFQRSSDPIARFAEHFRGRKASAEKKSPLTSLPIPERLARNIIDGTKEGLTEALDKALQQYPAPLDIINGPLMVGMAEVGRLFNNNELIVAEVLQSAEAMKAAVSHLEPHMEKTESATKGKIILATVKGDVHDIGKNLVGIILSNNGYEIIDLGIKVHPAALIEAVQEHQPDALGLSGLLVKSAKQMVVTAEDLKGAGITCPILVGGAALSERFTSTKIANATDSLVVYARDAMHGLDIANQLMNPETHESFAKEVRRRQDRLVRGGSEKSARAVAVYSVPGRSPKIPILEEVPSVPDIFLHFEVGLDLMELYTYINPQMLYSRHLGLRGNFTRQLAEGNSKAVELEKIILELLEDCREQRWLTPRAIWQFFPVIPGKDSITLHDPRGKHRPETVPLPRQQKPPFMCISDLVKPGLEGTPVDHLAMMVTTCGAGIRDLSQKWTAQGKYLRSHALQALALEMTEALAEWLHRKIRAQWGFPDPPEKTRNDLFKSKYRGKRYSFGYPACPDLTQQTVIWHLLRPDDHLGVSLTEEYMMDPEASVSALIFHHPAATYFGVGKTLE